ncbi:MAG: TIGR04283 family arsenosugar biosynthesis glycosyltransferase [Planctomycetota bacterium]
MPALQRAIVFTRCPVPGQTKTRLAARLGELPAAELHRRMAEATVTCARDACGQVDGDLEVTYSDADWRTMRRWLGGGILYRRQPLGDLGQRMAGAMQRALLDGARRVVLVGTDVPNVRPGHFREAWQALREVDLVLGATRDGGYWLIGARRPVDVFDGIAWSTDSVLQRTLELARRQNLRTHVLPPMADVDCAEDLDVVPDDWRTDRPVISVVVPALHEEENIEASLASARRVGVELLVCDGGSTDGTTRRARDAGAKILHSPPARARQMNRGARAAAGRILLFLHADTLLPSDYARQVFVSLLDRQVVGGGHAWSATTDGLAMGLARRYVNFRTRYRGEPWGDQAIFVRRCVFEQLGGFPDVPIAEDWFFVRSLRRRGRMAMVPSPVVTSARRWQRIGVARTFAINLVIVAGCHLGVPTPWLSKLY